ncbi:fused MFS/spermidine synthase [Actinoplanes sp. NPDC051861]|uniref:spermidine synthase n=1 Tax=Actinoplanes sp. NPDC051861 TaxID=3155170 RepID=UPI00341B888C
MATRGNRRTTLTALVASGVADLEPDPDRPRGWTLLIDGVPQSYVDLDDPEYLAFTYVRQIARAVRSWSGRSASRVPLKILHLGGGALTLPRLMARWWPDAAQKVVEHDPDLISLILREMPPAQPMEISVGDARTVLETEEQQGYAVIIADVFSGAAMPGSLATAGFATAAARALRPDGLLVMNLTDVPPLAFTRTQVATMRSSFDDVALLGQTGVLKGRRAGNVVLLAGAVPDVRPASDERLLRSGELVVFSGGARPRPDGSA